MLYQRRGGSGSGILLRMDGKGPAKTDLVFQGPGSEHSILCKCAGKKGICAPFFIKQVLVVKFGVLLSGAALPNMILMWCSQAVGSMDLALALFSVLNQRGFHAPPPESWEYGSFDKL